MCTDVHSNSNIAIIYGLARPTCTPMCVPSLASQTASSSPFYKLTSFYKKRRGGSGLASETSVCLGSRLVLLRSTKLYIHATHLKGKQASELKRLNKL